MQPKRHILPIIILAQFACTSLWFAGNTVLGSLKLPNGNTEALGYILSSVQFGFIIGTLVFALYNIADRYAPARVFLVSALLAASCNLTLLMPETSLTSIIVARLGTGFFLAGIYPVGMKIAADYYEKGLGKALGFLVGALVLGTAFPHLLKSFASQNNLIFVTLITSSLAIVGGLALWILVPNGPYRKPAAKLQLHAIPSLFSIPAFRKAAFGYFGHMWELYAFWGFVPLILTSYIQLQNTTLNIPLWSFIIIAIGAISCVIGGYNSIKYGSKKVAVIALSLSGAFCVLSPLLFHLPKILFLIAILLWSMAVIADSPQFSSLVAASVPAELKATALTIVNCIGFAITILSIQLLSHFVTGSENTEKYLLLGIGPLLGILSLLRK